jgi:hypothetical protein
MLREISNVRYKKVFLERIKFSIGQSFPYADLRDMELHEWVDNFEYTVRSQLDIFFLGKNHEIWETELVPETWWDAVKERFFLWTGCRVKKRVIEKVVKITNICPYMGVPEGRIKEKYIAYMINEGQKGE